MLFVTSNIEYAVIVIIKKLTIFSINIFWLSIYLDKFWHFKVFAKRKLYPVKLILFKSNSNLLINIFIYRLSIKNCYFANFICWFAFNFILKFFCRTFSKNELIQLITCNV